ncbi:major facilitator superfamily domain-containing protein [Linnemannia elongata]|nr:major facilitator superfamily domain-containing protein [Linnemannia elongata]
MAQQSTPSLDSTLGPVDDEPPSSQLESFPPLYITRSNVMHSPSLTLEPVVSSDPPSINGQGSRRWWILSLSCLLLFGNYFAYDNPAALNTQLQKYLEMPYNDYQYLLSTLYSVYSLPNTVLPFVFGSLVDRFGPQRVLLGLSACVCIGQTIFSVGVQTRQIWMMLVGRAIFGVGGESCGVAQASITTMHFRGHELAFALGLNLCIARFGSVVNTLVTPWAEQKWDVPTAIWIGTLSCVASFLSAVVLVMLIDRSPLSFPDSKEHELDTTTPLLSAHFPRSSTFDQPDSMPVYLPTSGTDETLSPTLVKSPSHPAILQHLPGILRREASFSESIRSVRFRPGYARSGTRPSLHIVTVQDESKQKLRFQQQQERLQESWWRQWVTDLEHFPSTFWLICALVVLLYGTVVPFNNIASDFLQSKWYHDNPRKAAAVMGIPDTLGAILVPGFGLVVDKYGGRASTLIASAFIMVVVHTTLGFTSLSPIFAFSLLGVAYSMYGVALWPSIACVVTNELHLGKGYGISTSFLNISLTIAPPIVATIRVIGNSFLPVEMFFIGMGLCGILVGFALKNIDRRDGGALEDPEIQVDVPVIVPQTATSTSTSTMASPALSQSRSRFRRQRKRPTLSCIQTLGSGSGSGAGPASGSGSLWTPKRWQNNLSEGAEAFESPRLTKAQGEGEGGIGDSSQDWNSPTISSPLVPNISTSLLTPKKTRSRKWFGRPLLHRTLTRVGSPLLQQYSSSPRRYGSFSSPSIASPRMDGDFDLEEGSEGGEKQVTAVEDYSVSQHPILYNPLRGSSGSFRISRTARPIAFGEGEEGLIYLNGQEVELGYDENNNNDDDDVEYQSGSEQDYEDEEFEGEGDNDETEHGSEVNERRGLGIEYNSSSNRNNQDGLTKSDSTADTITPDLAEET